MCSKPPTRVPSSQHSLSYYLGIYALLALGLGMASSARYMGFALMGIRSSTSMHSNLFANVLRAPMSWFDTTPLGRIVNRSVLSIPSMRDTRVPPRIFLSFPSPTRSPLPLVPLSLSCLRLPLLLPLLTLPYCTPIQSI